MEAFFIACAHGDTGAVVAAASAKGFDVDVVDPVSIDELSHSRRS